MRKDHRILVSFTSVGLLILTGVIIHFRLSPLNLSPQTKAGKVFDSVMQSAVRQKGLYNYIEAYHKKFGDTPQDLDELINQMPGSMHFTGSPKGHPYVLFPENYGHPDKVFLTESRGDHDFSLNLWLRGYNPQVETLGDGTVHLFKDGEIATMQARKK